MGVTVTLVAPVARLAGTVAVTEVALQAVVVAAVVPKRTVPPLPRLVPAMMTLAPVRAWLGVRLVSAAAGTAAGTVMLYRAAFAWPEELFGPFTHHTL